MAKYVTKQRKLFIDYLEKHADELITAKQIATALSSEDISISAVYRNLAELESEGKVRKTSKPSDRNIYYQYTGAKKCKESLHISCSKCGKSYHLNSDIADMLIKGLNLTENFIVDKSSSVISGICQSCQK